MRWAIGLKHGHESPAVSIERPGQRAMWRMIINPAGESPARTASRSNGPSR